MYLFHSKADALRTRGFTLVELLVSFAIMTLISSVVLVRFNGFDSTVLLKSQAYVIASSIRDAQVYAISSRAGKNSSFRKPYGMSFTPDSTNYMFFQYTGSDPRPSYTSGNFTDIATLLLEKSMKIYAVCETTGATEKCDLTRLDISFKRPEFKAYFYAVNASDVPYTEPNQANITSAKIKVKSDNGTTKWTVSIGLLGQITVALDS